MIDVITTVYNTPINDLEKCFNSIKNQTLKDWKTIIIDDGSNPEIKSWLDTWCEKNSKFEVIHIKNGGVSNARNLGLELSKNDYVTFCDSDDTFSKNFLEEALNIMKANDVDIVMGGTEVVYKDRKELKVSFNDKLYKDIKPLHKYMLSSFCSKDNKELNTIFAGRIYPKLYKKEVLKNIFFDKELIMHEDNLFISDLFNKAKSIYVSKDIWYQYYQNDYSITKVKYSEKLLQQELLFIEKLNQRKSEYEKNNLINDYYIRCANTFLIYINRLKYSDKNIKNELTALFKNRLFQEIYNINTKNYDIPLKKKILLNLLKIKILPIKVFIFKFLLAVI